MTQRLSTSTSHDGASASSGSDDGSALAAAAAAADGRSRSPLLQISNALVRLYKEAFGRGPTKARAQFVGPDTLVVVLEDSMTVVERNQLAMNQPERVRDTRLSFQDAMEDRFRETVEEVLGRRTVAFISGIDPRHDVSIELFTLEPHDDGTDPGQGRATNGGS
jgi:uncharacterized protein YbcI